MKVTYLDHSGFLLELKDRYYVFDYYKGVLPPLDKEKEVLVFCSHCHGDHYNPKIFVERRQYSLVIVKHIVAVF